VTPAERDLTWLRRWISLAIAMLIFSSWQLWRGGGDFPQIPWLPVLVRAPAWVDLPLTVLLLTACGLGVVARNDKRWTRVTSRLQWGLHSALLLLDQHRLQPWAYQFWLLLGVQSLSGRLVGLRCSRAVVISIYVWSGLSKIDPGFVSGHGQMLLDGLLQAAGLRTARLNENAREFAAALMPVAELVVALLLAWPRTRRTGVAASIVLHGLLLLSVGPLGLGHETGVLIWNVYFIGQNVLLFHGPTTGLDAVAVGSAPYPSFQRAAIGLTIVAVAAPALNPLGAWDNWPSWSVYSAHPAIVRVYIDDAEVPKLPGGLQALVGPPEPLQTWRHVALDQWSFRERSVPPYPQERWKLALAATLAKRSGLTQLRVEELRREGWWTPERSVTRYQDVQALDARIGRAWANTSARD
jgi:hypothetical protein